jgi:hypothetical protein
LHHIFRFRIVPQDGSRHAIDPLIVPPHQNLVESGVPVSNTPHKLVVSRFIPL